MKVLCAGIGTFFGAVGVCVCVLLCYHLSFPCPLSLVRALVLVLVIFGSPSLSVRLLLRHLRLRRLKFSRLDLLRLRLLSWSSSSQLENERTNGRTNGKRSFCTAAAAVTVVHSYTQGGVGGTIACRRMVRDSGGRI